MRTRETSKESRKKIADLTAALDERRESNHRFREILENLDLIAIMLDRKGTVTFCNNSLLRVTGWKREEVIGHAWFDRFLPDPAAATQAVFFAGIATGTIPPHQRNPLRTKAGEIREVSWNNTMLRDGAGNVIGTASIGEDVTDTLRAEVARGESETRFRELAENIQEVFWVANPAETKKLYISPAYEKIWGRTCQSAYDSPHAWLEAVPPEDRERVRRAVLNKESQLPYDEEYRILRPDGAERWIRDRAFPVRDAAGAIRRWVGVAEDITARKHAEAELHAAQRQLRALVGRLHIAREEEARRIARELHDDLGQELTALNMELADLTAKLPAATAPQRAQFERMNAIVNHTIEIVQEISGQLRLGQLDVLGLTAAIDWHVEEFSRRSAIACRITRLDEVANLSDAQKTTLFRILQEALTNVVRHASATAVEISMEAGPERVTLTVCDNGRGITDAELGDRNSIGLLGMRERAQNIAGDVTVTGEPGGGTTVVVRIPLDRSGGKR